MALSEEQTNDKIEVVNTWAVHVRRATIIKKDGAEIARTFNRHVLQPGRLDASNNLIDTDISGEDADVQAICNAAWTTTVKNNFKAHAIAEKAAQPGG